MGIDCSWGRAVGTRWRGQRGGGGGAGGTPRRGGGGGRPPGGGAGGGGGHGKGTADVPMWDGKGPPCGVAKGGAAGQWGASRDLGTKGDAKGGAGSGGKAAPAEESGEGRRTWAKPQAVLDDDGYELVQPRRVRTNKGGPKGGEAGGTPAPKGGSDGAATAVAARRLWSDEDSDDDGGLEDEDDGGDCGEGAEEGGDEVPDPRQLRKAFEDYAKTVRDMEKRGSYGPALDTLRQARDAAEESWRRAKAPAPLPRRLDWAEAKLRKAQAALTRVRLELDRFDKETDRRRADLLGRIGEAEAWYKWRQQQLDAIHDEAAERAPGRRGGGPCNGGAVEVREKLRGHVLPEMQAILEEVQEGTAVHERLALLVAGLAEAEARLGDQRDDDGPAHYDMYDGDSQYEGWQGEHQPTTEEAEDGMQHGGPGGDHRNGRPAVEWRPEGPGRWSRAATSSKGTQQSQPYGAATTGGQPLNQAMGEGVSGKGMAQVSAPARADSGSAAAGKGGAVPEEGEDDGGERAGKHRRRRSDAEATEEARMAADARRAEELHRQLQIASAA